jgi:hypothetical protein
MLPLTVFNDSFWCARVLLQTHAFMFCRFMGSVVGILQQYTAAAANGAQPEAALARRMDGALLAIGVMSDILKAKVG